MCSVYSDPQKSDLQIKLSQMDSQHLYQLHFTQKVFCSMSLNSSSRVK